MWQPLSFFSKKLSPAETRYSAFDLELLGVYATIKHFRHNLEGRNFFVNTDHKPLIFVMSSVTERPSLCQTRHLAFIAEFTTDIGYVKGETNLVADELSRLAEYGIIIGPEKCQFGATELSFLGHHVCAEGILPLPSAVDAIVNFVKPEKQRALRRYLGMVNYYHRFIPQCAAKLTPLNNLLTAANDGHTRLLPKSNFELKWDENAESVFSESKQILANVTLLVHPDPMAHHV